MADEVALSLLCLAAAPSPVRPGPFTLIPPLPTEPVAAKPRPKGGAAAGTPRGPRGGTATPKKPRPTTTTMGAAGMDGNGGGGGSTPLLPPPATTPARKHKPKAAKPVAAQAPATDFTPSWRGVGVGPAGNLWPLEVGRPATPAAAAATPLVRVPGASGGATVSTPDRPARTAPSPAASPRWPFSPMLQPSILSRSPMGVGAWPMGVGALTPVAGGSAGGGGGGGGGPASGRLVLPPASPAAFLQPALARALGDPLAFVRRGEPSPAGLPPPPTRPKLVRPPTPVLMPGVEGEGGEEDEPVVLAAEPGENRKAKKRKTRRTKR